MKRAAILSFALIALIAQRAQAETLIENVDGITLNEKDQVQKFHAILIGDDGRVKKLFSGRDALPVKVAKRIDGKHQTLVPGFIDSHVHLSGLGAFASRLDLAGAASWADAQRKILAYAHEFPQVRWITGSGWSPDWWPAGTLPNAADLDKVVSQRPVWLVRGDRKAGWANSAALALAGITASTPDPVGGRIERKSDGTPTGLFFDGATKLIEDALKQTQSGQSDAALAAGQRLLLGMGITAVSELATSAPDWETYRRAGDAHQLKIRIMAYATPSGTLTQLGGPGPAPWLYNDHLRLNGLKIFTDGGLHARDAWLKAPYSDAPDTVGVKKTTGAALRAEIQRAAIDGYQVAIHAIGDAANTEALNALDELAPTYAGDRRWLVVHAQIVDSADIARFGKHGIIASMSPIHATADWRIDQDRLGPDRLKGAHPWKSIRATGAKLAFGSDAPIYSPDVFAGFAAAISRTDANGEPAGGWQPQEKIDRVTAFAAYTSWGAYAGFAEKRFGRLAPGMHADFVLINTNPLVATPAQIRATKVLETWVDGAKVFDAKKDAPLPVLQWLLREADAEH